MGRIRRQDKLKGKDILGEYEPLRRTVSSGVLRRVALVRTDVSEELNASIIRVT
jgi:hypothetical protein